MSGSPGTRAAIEAAARKVPGVRDVRIEEALGQVRIYVAGEDADLGDRVRLALSDSQFMLGCVYYLITVDGFPG